MKIDFRIEHIDPLGQGVDKSHKPDAEKPAITFIKKTLPQETGLAQVFGQKKGVRFARIVELTSQSPQRIAPFCPHFNQCNGCDYQHTHYQQELEFKKMALERHLQKFPKVPITIHAAPKRFEYRNRIQLHYNKKLKLLGMLDAELKIIPVPECKIISPSLSYELRALLTQNQWLNLVAKEPNEGHIELYAKATMKGHNVQVAVNKPYAHGGFTQINAAMNDLLCQWVQNRANELIAPKSIIYDLFGGNGNLSAKFKNSTIVVDKYRHLPENIAHQKFFSIDLYGKSAISELIALKNQGIARPDWLIFDPPRSGLKNITEFLNEFKPEGFIFIACDPTSFARDLFPVLNHYEINSVELFDLFPATMHFETVGIFTRRKNNV